MKRINSFFVLTHRLLALELCSLENRKNLKKSLHMLAKRCGRVKQQRNYSSTKRDLFAVVFCTSFFKEFLLGQTFQIIIDHHALVWLYSFKELDAIVARYLEKLSLFDFEIVHRPGKTFDNADALSRLPKLNLSATSVTSALSPLRFAETQDQDKIILAVKSWCQSGEKTT